MKYFQNLAVLCKKLSPEDKAFLITEIGLAIAAEGRTSQQFWETIQRRESTLPFLRLQSLETGRMHMGCGMCLAMIGNIASAPACAADDMLLGVTDDSFLDAGFLKIGNFEGYLVFLDLVTGEVVHIYHEAVYDMSIVDGVDVSDYEEVRDYLSGFTLCKDFYDFLRLVCTKDIYNEDCLEFIFSNA